MTTGPEPSRATRTVVFRGGPVFCADAAGSIVSAVAVRDGIVVARGGDAEVAAAIAHPDEVVDLAGRMLVPGFIDAHVHPIMGGIERGRCDLSGQSNVDDYRSTIARYAAANPDLSWIRGGGWAMSAFAGGVPHRSQLDDIVGDRPVLLPNRDHHSAWANSAALRLAGIGRDTPDPPDGRIERDSTGEPTGALHEGAEALVARLVPPDTQQDYDDGLRRGQQYLHSCGVTAWQDAIVHPPAGGPSEHVAYLNAQREGWLTASVIGALWWDRSRTVDQIGDLVDQFTALRSESDSLGGRYRAHAVKIMQDGVAETFTAAMLEPYLDRCGHRTDNAGLSFVEPGVLNSVVRELDSRRFQIHFHALGDRAVRESLDALEAALARNGSRDARHHLAHLQVVDPVDVRRFRGLGATATLQALWAAHDEQMDELTIPFLGEQRSGLQYPFGDLYRAGAPLAMGSDWPVSTPDPWAAIHVAVNRVLHGAADGTPALLPEQALPLAVALRAYTAGSAHVNGWEAERGSISPGMRADLVVLDRDPFAGPVDALGAVRIAQTWVDGALVHAS